MLPMGPLVIDLPQGAFVERRLAVAENRSHLADDAGNVFVDDVEQRSFGLELDAEVVHRDDALVLLTEQGRRHADFVGR